MDSHDSFGQKNWIHFLIEIYLQTMLTAISMSAIATNGVVPAGGARNTFSLTIVQFDTF